MKNYVTKYTDFLIENKGEPSIKGIPANNMIKKIEAIMEVLPNEIEFGVPSDNLGQSTSYKNAADAIQRIKDIKHYYDKRKQEVKFYCWSVTFNGPWNASQELEDQMVEQDGLYHDNKEKYGKIDLIKVRDYIQSNPEESGDFKSFSISLDSTASRNYGIKLSELKDDEKTDSKKNSKKEKVDSKEEEEV